MRYLVMASRPVPHIALLLGHRALASTVLRVGHSADSIFQWIICGPVLSCRTPRQLLLRCHARGASS